METICRWQNVPLPLASPIRRVSLIKPPCGAGGSTSLPQTTGTEIWTGPRAEPCTHTHRVLNALQAQNDALKTHNSAFINSKGLNQLLLNIQTKPTQNFLAICAAVFLFFFFIKRVNRECFWCCMQHNTEGFLLIFLGKRKKSVSGKKHFIVISCKLTKHFLES